MAPVAVPVVQATTPDLQYPSGPLPPVPDRSEREDFLVTEEPPQEVLLVPELELPSRIQTPRDEVDFSSWTSSSNIVLAKVHPTPQQVSYIVILSLYQIVIIYNLQ